MGTRNFSLMLLLCILFFSACKKEANNPTNGSIPKIETVTIYTDSTFSIAQSIYTYNYDTSGRCTNLFYRTDSSEYVYSGSTITMKSRNYSAVYTLNSKGQAISYINSIYPTSPTKYEYDAEGYLIKLTVFISDTVTNWSNTYSYTSGNQTSIVYSGGVTTDQIFSDKLNTIGNENRGILFLGKQNKNLVSSSTETGGMYTNTTTYQYEFDSKGRVIKETEKINNGEGYYRTYTYKD